MSKNTSKKTISTQKVADKQPLISEESVLTSSSSSQSQRLVTVVIVFVSLAILLVFAMGLFIFSTVTPIKYDSENSSDNHSMNSMMHMDNEDHMIDIFDDKTFLEKMIDHHDEAVRISTTVYLRSSDADIQDFTQKVIATQSKEISDMRSWYKDWYGTEYTPSNSHDMMRKDLLELRGKDLDKAYVEDMIIHHEAAVIMAKQVKITSQKSEIKDLADTIIKTQEAEIRILTNWRSSKY